MLNIKLLKICQALIKAISYDECPNMKRDRCPTASKKRLLSVTTLVNSIFEICLFFYQIGSSIYLKKQVYLCPKNSVKETTIANCFKTVWSTEVSKEKLVDFALDEIPCPPQMECETFKSQVDIKVGNFWFLYPLVLSK